MVSSLMKLLSQPSFQQRLLTQIVQHLSLSTIAIVAAIAIAVPVGILLTRLPRVAGPVLAAVGLLQTLPSLALLAFMIPLFGIGRAPAIFALFLYALLPILRNTYTGIKGVDPAALEAGRGMGMTGLQLLFMVELPLALRVIIGGVRTASVMIIGWATLAAFVGGGGLGNTIMTGFYLVSTPQILAGGIPVTLMALLADWVLGVVERAAVPKGVRV